MFRSKKKQLNIDADAKNGDQTVLVARNDSDPAQQKTPEFVVSTPLVDRTDKGDNIGRLLLVGLGLLGLVGLFSILPNATAQRVTLITAAALRPHHSIS